MNDEQRIKRIKQARTREELGQATAGYQEQVISAHPALQNNSAFNSFMQRGRFFLALSSVKRATRGAGDEYKDVIQVLECASERDLALVY